MMFGGPVVLESEPVVSDRLEPQHSGQLNSFFFTGPAGGWHRE